MLYLILKYLTLAAAAVCSAAVIMCFTGPFIFPKKYTDKFDVNLSFIAGVILALISWLLWYSFLYNLLTGISFCLLIVSIFGSLFFSLNIDFNKGVRKYSAFILGAAFSILLAVGSAIFFLFSENIIHILG